MQSTTLLTKGDIINILKVHKKELLREYGVKKIGMFGSVARNEQTRESDIDIIVELDYSDPEIHHKFFALYNYLENIFNKKVDIVTSNSLKNIRSKSIKDGISRGILYA